MRTGLLITLSLLLLLTGCGFQPRGTSALPAADLGPVVISGLPVHHHFHRVLTEELNRAGIATGERQSAATEIRILRQKRDRNILSVDSRGKTVEYEIEESVAYRLLRQTADGDNSLKELESKRILFNPGTELLGRNREEALLRQDMYRELARQLINHLATI